MGAAMSDIVDVNLSVALTALHKARLLVEGTIVGDEAATLRHVYALLLDASGPVAGARAVLRQCAELDAVLGAADTGRTSHLRLVK